MFIVYGMFVRLSSAYVYALLQPGPSLSCILRALRLMVYSLPGLASSYGINLLRTHVISVFLGIFGIQLQ